MANPFGELVDDEKLNTMTRYYEKKKTQEDRAREAMRVRTGVAQEEARKYVDEVKEFYDDGTCTLCMIYNATGETLYYVDDCDFNGNVDRTPYPTHIGNGQWVSFLHVHPSWELKGSEAAVLYRGKQKDGYPRDFMLSWYTPCCPFCDNKAYCEMREVGKSSTWNEIYNRTILNNDTDKVDRDGMIVEVSTASGKAPVFTALLTIPYSP